MDVENGGQTGRGGDKILDLGEYRAKLSQAKSEQDYQDAINEREALFRKEINDINLSDPAHINESGQIVRDVIAALVIVSGDHVEEGIPTVIADETGIHLRAAEDALGDARQAQADGDFNLAFKCIADARTEILEAIRITFTAIRHAYDTRTRSPRDKN